MKSAPSPPRNPVLAGVMSPVTDSGQALSRAGNFATSSTTAGEPMALWKDTTPGTPSQTPVPPAKDTFAQAERPAAAASNVAPLNPAPATPRSSSRERPEMKESVIAADLTIEGKII